MNPSDIMRARVLRELDRLGALQPTLGRDAALEIDGALAAALGFDGLRLVNVTAGVRRRRIRRAARARKAPRGWR